MKTNNFIQKSVSQIALELFQGTKVESAFDQNGEFSHLVAWLSQNEFTKLYTVETTVTIFIKGYWLQFSLHNKNKKVLNRDTNTTLLINFYNNSIDQTCIEFKKNEKKIGTFKYNKYSIDDFLFTSNGYYAIARAAIKIFSKYNKTLHKKEHKKIPCVQILPEIENDLQFDANNVQLH